MIENFDGMRELLRTILDRNNGFHMCQKCCFHRLVHRMGTRLFCAECVVKEFGNTGMDVAKLNEMDVAPYAFGVPVWAKNYNLWKPAIVVGRGSRNFRVIFSGGQPAYRSPSHLAIRDPSMRGGDCPTER